MKKYNPLVKQCVKCGSLITEYEPIYEMTTFQYTLGEQNSGEIIHNMTVCKICYEYITEVELTTIGSTPQHLRN